MSAFRYVIDPVVPHELRLEGTPRFIAKYTVEGSGSPINTTGSYSGSVPVGSVYRLIGVTMHLSGSSIAENFVVKLDSYSGSNFDVILNTTAMNGLSDVAYTPTNDFLLQGGDAIVVSYTNTNLRIYGIEIVFEIAG